MSSVGSQGRGCMVGPADAGLAVLPAARREMHELLVRAVDGSLIFIAPWGEPMVAPPGDAIVRRPQDPADTYRIAAAAFACSCEILQPAP